MSAAEDQLIGEWRQIEPNPRPASIFVIFKDGGSLRYTIHTATIQHILLTWRIEGDSLITNQPATPREEKTRFRLETPSHLVLEHAGEMFVYNRV